MNEQKTDWHQVKVGDFLTEHSERSTSSNQYEVLSVTKDGIFSQREFFKKQIASEDNSGYKVVSKGDVVFSAMNLWMGSIDVVKDQEIGIVSPAYITMRPTEELVDTDFLGYFLRGDEMRKKYVQHSQQGASIVRRNLNKEDLLADEVAIPPLPEQKKIAEILSEIDTRISAESRKLEKLFYLMQAAIEAEVQLRSRKSPSLPLSSFFAVKPSNGISPPETEGEEFINAPGIDCISKSGFEVKRLKKVRRPEDWHRYLVKEGDFFITRANTPALVGMCAVATRIEQEMIYPDLMIRLQFKKPMHATYLESVFRSSSYRHIIQNSAQGTSQSMAKLNAQIISNIKVTIPEDLEVKQFNKNIKSILETIRLQKSMIERLQKLKSGVSQDLLSGSKRVSV